MIDPTILHQITSLTPIYTATIITNLSELNDYLIMTTVLKPLSTATLGIYEIYTIADASIIKFLPIL